MDAGSRLHSQLDIGAPEREERGDDFQEHLADVGPGHFPEGQEAQRQDRRSRARSW